MISIKHTLSVTAAVAAIVISALASPVQVQAAYNSGNLIDDFVFLNATSMSQDDIQKFLTSMGGGIANMTFLFDCASTDVSAQYYQAAGAPCGQTVQASTIIYYAAQVYGVNPKVILATMQKEQSLVTAVNPTSWQTNQAMGYGCPDNGGCGASNFLYQIDNGTWCLRLNMERARGNMTYWFTSSTWVCGSSKNYYKPSLYPNQNVSFYDDAGTLYNTTYIANASTASMYCYTPHTYNNPSGLYGLPAYGTTGQYYSGSYNFVYYYERWFGSTQDAPTVIAFKSHLSNLGWTNSVQNHGITGTVGQSRPMEAFRIDGDVSYSSYSYTSGWQPTVSNGMISGTTSIGKPIQAITIGLNGTLSAQYDIWYRTHLGGIGWVGWVKNGQPAGITGSPTSAIEAFEIQLMPKGSGAPGTTANAYQNIATATDTSPLQVQATAHVGNVGWSPTLSNDMVIGTTEQSKRIEAFTLSLVNNTGIPGGIAYSAHLAGIGWQPFMTNGAMAGTTGQARQVEAVRIALTGSLGDNYDIWYRGFIRFRGWQGWASNGEAAGSVGVGYQLEGIELHIVPKGKGAFPRQGALFNPLSLSVPASSSLSYSVHASNLGWITGVQPDQIGGTVGQSRPLEALRFDTVTSAYGDVAISCSVYIHKEGWTQPVAVTGNTCGTTGQSKPIESVKLSLTGSAASKYTLYYKTHRSFQGWLDWSTNGVQAGEPGTGRLVEAVMIKLVPKP